MVPLSLVELKYIAENVVISVQCNSVKAYINPAQAVHK